METLEASTKIDVDPDIEFSDEFVTVTRERTTTIAGDAVTITDGHVSPGNITTHEVAQQVVSVRGAEVYRETVMDATTTFTYVDSSVLFTPPSRPPGADTPPPNVNEDTSDLETQPPIGPRYAYTDKLYAVHINRGVSTEFPPKILFFAVDKGVIGAEIIHQITLPIAQRNADLALFSD
jgi:hypothetical protein